LLSEFQILAEDMGIIIDSSWISNFYNNFHGEGGIDIFIWKGVGVRGFYG
jgi:hypothetical protein